MWQKLSANNFFRGFVSYVGLFSSVGTLLCCALPSALVLLGFGASMATFLGEFPQLIWLSENKGMVFSTSFLMLGLSYAGKRYSASMACPIDQQEDCEKAKSWSGPLFLISLILTCIGAFSAYVLPRLL